jgi:putative ABC transport system permease protein
MNNMLSKTRENLRIAIATLFSSKLRAFLTMLGITIGVMSVVLLLSVGQAFEEYVVGEFSSFGSNLVAVNGERSSTTQSEAGMNVNDADAQTRTTFFENLSWNDYLALSDRFRVPDARIVSPIAMMAFPVTWEDNELDVAVAGVTETYLEAVSINLGGGRFLSSTEIQESARVTVLNKMAAHKLFGDVYPIGEMVKIRGLSFEIIGVTDLGASEEAESLIIPITTLYQRLSSDRMPDGSLPVAMIMMQATDAGASKRLTSQVRQTLRDEHDLDPEDDDDFMIFSQNDILEILSGITSLITAFLAVIAGISLVVGGIGIMNIMLVTVTERTREIGLRKAVGAQKSDILFQFIIEAIMLSVLGGFLGTVLAFLLSLMIRSQVPELNIVIQPSSVILATVVSIMIGVFFGAFPANRAAKMNPIDALRFE